MHRQGWRGHRMYLPQRLTPCRVTQHWRRKTSFLYMNGFQHKRQKGLSPKEQSVLLSQNWELGASGTLQVRGSRSCSTSWKCPGRPLFPDPNNEWSSSNVPSAEDEAGRLHSTQLHWNPSTVWLCSSSQLYFYQWEASRGLFINCVRKCLMYSPESSRAE